MRLAASSAETPPSMEGAWHIDAHTGAMPGPLPPADLVAAVFHIRCGAIVVGDELQTMFGKFYVDAVHADSSLSHVLLHTWAPGLTSRFAITVRREPGQDWRAVLHNSVHPTSWLGRVYFRLIEIGHHWVMEIALRRLRAAAHRRMANG